MNARLLVIVMVVVMVVGVASARGGGGAASAAVIRARMAAAATTTTPSPTAAPLATGAAVSRRPFYLVSSPESNGNRYLVELLVAHGCYGKSGHVQPFDDRRAFGGNSWPNHLRRPDRFPRTLAPCLAMHRSIPHNKVWVDLAQLVREITAVGYEPRILVSLRAEHVAEVSQVSRKHVRTIDQAHENIHHAQRHIFEQLATMPTVWFRVVLYEQLAHEDYVRWLVEHELGLTLAAEYPRFEDRDAYRLAELERLANATTAGVVAMMRGL